MSTDPASRSAAEPALARRAVLAIAAMPPLLQVHQASAAEPLTVTRASALPPRRGPADHFTGDVQVSSSFQASPPARASGGIVTFAPEGRTAWHTHPLGQTLVVLSGSGLVQNWGSPAQRIGVGDVVWIPPNVKHWHGAGPADSMSHLAVSEALEGKTVDWKEHVSDAQYASVSDPP